MERKRPKRKGGKRKLLKCIVLGGIVTIGTLWTVLALHLHTQPQRKSRELVAGRVSYMSSIDKESQHFVVGFCEGDNLSLFAHHVGKALGDAMGKRWTELKPVVRNGDEQSVDILFCERGSTAVIERKLSRSNLALQQVRSPFYGWQKRSGEPGFYMPRTLQVIVDTSTGQLAKPFIVRYHMEPWKTDIRVGVDVAIDCKTDQRLFSPKAPHLFAPYLFVSFAHRQPLHPNVLTEARLLDNEKQSETKRRFLGFLASYCSARLKAAALRSFFFNLVAERLSGKGKREMPDAIGNCQPRAVRDKKPSFRLRAASNLVQPDVFKQAVEAYRKYRFALAFENSQVPGYITEKIVNVKLAGAIPVYWGAPDVIEYLNPSAFIWCNVSTQHIRWDQLFKEATKEGKASADVMDTVEKVVMNEMGLSKSFEDCLKEIERLDNDPVAYKKVQNEPLVKSLPASVLDPSLYATQLLTIWNAQQDAVKSYFNPLK